MNLYIASLQDDGERPWPDICACLLSGPPLPRAGASRAAVAAAAAAAIASPRFTSRRRAATMPPVSGRRRRATHAKLGAARPPMGR